MSFTPISSHSPVSSFLHQAPPNLTKSQLWDLLNSKTPIEEYTLGQISELMQNGFDPFSIDPNHNDRSPLTQAIAMGHENVVKQFLTTPAQMSGPDALRYEEHRLASINSPELGFLSLACGGGCLEIAKMLLDARASIEIPDHNGMTALHGASGYGHEEIVALLLSHPKGKNPSFLNAQSDFTVTALYLACMKGYLEIAKMLLDAGASIEIPDNKGRTALHEVSPYNRKEIVALLLSHPKGKNPTFLNAQDFQGGTPLHLACQEGDLEIANMLLDAGASIEIPGYHRKTTLHEASSSGHKEIVALLISQPEGKNSSFLNAQEKNGRTALHIACEQGHLDIAKMLLDAGASIEIPDNKGTTALHQASSSGHKEIVALLMSPPEVEIPHF